MSEVFKNKFFRKSYLFALGLIGLFSISSYTIIQIAIDEQDAFSEIINISGRQRMLSQRTMLLVTEWVQTGQGQERADIEQELRKSLSLFESSHSQLTKGKMLDGKKYHIPKAVQNIYDMNLDQLVKNYISQIKSILNGNKEALPELSKMAKGELLVKLDQAVKGYEQESKRVVTRLKLIELCILLFIICTLILEVIYIFSPLEKSLKDAFGELEVANDKAHKALQAKSDFLANMTHELRSPIHAIIGSSDLLKIEKDTDRKEEYFQIIDSCSKSLLQTVNDLLDFEKLSKGKGHLDLSWVAINKVVEELKLLFKLLALDHGTSLNFQNELGELSPKLDLIKFNQILTNLISNAIKFTPDGEVTIHFSKEDHALKVRVQDNGAGIDPEFQAKLFQPFEQGFESKHMRGTGLGLSLVSQLVNLMQGEIQVDSTPGLGTTFSFSLPCKFKQVSQKSTSSEPFEKKLLKNLNILVAEDNLINQKVTGGYIEKLGHKCTIVVNGAEAVQAFDDLKYDLVLMDIMMPVMDGKMALKLILPYKKRCKVVAFSANGLQQDIDHYLELGFDAVLTKPLKLEKLKAFLDSEFEDQDFNQSA